MVALPLHDQAGNALTGFRFATEPPPATTASLVVVRHANTVLMMFDSWRKQWELPGGMREPNETPYQAAIRELHEETGIQAATPTLTAVADFDLTNPTRQESLAIYQVRLEVVPQLTVNDEALAFRWWPPSEPVSDDMSPLDAEIARRVVKA